MEMMKHFLIVKRSNAGYQYTEVIDNSKPSMWLDGNGYCFNKTMISRVPIPLIRKIK